MFIKLKMKLNFEPRHLSPVTQDLSTEQFNMDPNPNLYK